MNPIGGYFELELRKGEEYHKQAIRLNTGRNAFEYILRAKDYKKVYLPYYTCDVMLEPIYKLNLEVEFYHINEQFEPIFNFNRIGKDETFLYTNYFGLKDSFITEFANLSINLIIDNTLSFFSKPIPNIPTFYSCRKFFGVPDGAYLYLDGALNLDLPFDHSENRLAHLLTRIEFGAQKGYVNFKINDSRLLRQPIMQMSKLTKALLCNIDYEIIKNIRLKNFLFLHKNLSNLNKLNVDINNQAAPMVYPFLSDQLDLKQRLIDKKIFVATYWPNVLEWCKKDDLEYTMAKEITYLPIDQRYGEKEMELILSQIKNY